MALRLRSSRRSSFGRNVDRLTQRSTDDQETVRPTQLALDQVSSMLTPLRNAQAWLQERTAPPSVETQLRESKAEVAALKAKLAAKQASSTEGTGEATGDEI